MRSAWGVARACGSLSTAVYIPTTKHSGPAHKGARVQRSAQLARLQQGSVECFVVCWSVPLASPALALLHLPR